MMALPENATAPATASGNPGHSGGAVRAGVTARQKPAARPSRRASLAAT